MIEKTFQFQTLEAHIYQQWEDQGVFACDPESQKQPYVIMMPPANVTGRLHLGHALTYTLQDVLVRFKRLSGFDVLWQPGTDHAGIATQMVVEQQLATQGLSRQDLGRENFINQVWLWKEESGQMIVSQQRRMGVSPDWSRQRFTMDEGLSHAVLKVFVNLYQQGLIYRGKRLVNWDTCLQTAISDLEVITREVKGHLWYIRYPLVDNPKEAIIVATTRPETLLGDVAIAVHPEDPRYQALIGKKVKLPLTERSIPIIADTYSQPDKGSGAVKITPGHDFNDFEVGKRHDLPIINILTAAGLLNDQVPHAYQGMTTEKARTKVIQDLEEQNLLDHVEPITHAVPYGDRSGVIIEPWLTDQWFIDAKTLAQPAIEAVEKGETKFIPSHWTATYFEWLRNIQPWCISRQLWWGHQIPAWYGPDGQVFVAETEAEAYDAAQKSYGSSVALIRDPDVLDTWFSSALWPFSTLGWPEKTVELTRYYPTDVLITGFDIIFFWVARMMMMGLHFAGKVPFRDVYIHALVRDEQGQKMSKSKGNIIDPLDIVERYGCDAVRMTLTANATPGRDIKVGESRLEGYRNFMTKLWNAARFLEMNTCHFDPEFVPLACKHILNRWIVSEVTQLAAHVSKSLDMYRFDEATSHIYHFLWGTYCDYYLEFLKPVFSEDSSVSRESKKTAAWAFTEFLKIAHPFIPFITETLWQTFVPAGGLLTQQKWPLYDSSDYRDETAQAEMRWTMDIINQIRSLRATFRIPPATFLTVSTHEKTLHDRLERQKSLICRLARLTDIHLSLKSEKALTFLCEGVSFCLHVGEHIDVKEEVARLQREISHHETEIAQNEKKLNNPDFRARAKAEVVSEIEDRLKTALNAKTLKLKYLEQLS